MRNALTVAVSSGALLLGGVAPAAFAAPNERACANGMHGTHRAHMTVPHRTEGNEQAHRSIPHFCEATMTGGH